MVATVEHSAFMPLYSGGVGFKSGEREMAALGQGSLPIGPGFHEVPVNKDREEMVDYRREERKTTTTQPAR